MSRTPTPGLALALALGACSTPGSSLSVVLDVAAREESGWGELEAERLEHARLEARARSTAVEAFWAAELGAVLHALASDEPFWFEPVAGAERPSPTAHLVVAAALAGRARALGPGVREQPVPLGLRPLVPEPGGGHAAVLRQLELLSALVQARLGLPAEPLAVAGPPPAGEDPAVVLAWARGLPLPDPLRPWLLCLASRELRGSDERTAYRLAILAIEGEERFGRPLPPAEVAELEDWILEGASVRFLCPRSQTPYVPGQRRSPISGIPHLEYRAIGRP